MKDTLQDQPLRKSYNGPSLLQRARNDSFKKKQNNLRASYNSAMGKKEEMLLTSPKKERVSEPTSIPSPRKQTEIKYYSEPKT